MTTNIVTHRPSTAKTATEERRQLALDTLFTAVAVLSPSQILGLAQSVVELPTPTNEQAANEVNQRLLMACCALTAPQHVLQAIRRAVMAPHDTCECCDAEEGVIDGLCIDCRAADAEYRANLDDEY